MVESSEKATKKKRHWWIAIPAGILLLFSSLAIYAFFAIPYNLPLTEISNLGAPYIDLTEIEASLHLVRENDSSDLTFLRLYNRITKKNSPWSGIEVNQRYQAYSSENKNELVHNSVSLTTVYYNVKFPQTVEKIADGNGYSSYSVHKAYRRGDEITDSRFDQCRIWTDDIIETTGRQRNDFTVMVVKGQHFMCIDYSGGNLTPGCFLDELARILIQEDTK